MAGVNATSLQQAISFHQKGNFDEAEKLYRSVLVLSPNDPDALALLGSVCGKLHKTEEALSLLDKACALDAETPLFPFYRAEVLAENNALLEAVEAYKQALLLAPNMLVAQYNLANALRQLNRWDEARLAYEKTLKLDPNHAEAMNNLALVYEHEENYAEAIAHLQQTVKIAPNYAESWINLSRIAELINDYPLSLEAGQKAIEVAPINASSFFVTGVVLNRLDRHEEAAVCYRAALEIDPSLVPVLDNLGQTYNFMNKLEDAEKVYRKVIHLAGQDINDTDLWSVPEKDIGNYHWHLALLELVKGDYLHGFARYRARFQELPIKRFASAQPVWSGENLNGKTILITDEQGLGDALMMARFLPKLKERGARVLFLVQSVLMPLLEGWDAVDQIISRDDTNALPPFDYHASIFDLPYVFGSTLDTLPSKTPYLPLLWPDEGAFLADGKAFRVGVVWGGSPAHKHDARRSIPLEIFSDLFAVEGARFYNLNRDLREGDSEILTKFATDRVVNLVPRLQHFGDLARFVAQMDLIITCDTATAHLAGGMGKDVWTLLPFMPDWRWLLTREDSVWYPTMRLFRQERSGNWKDVIRHTKTALNRVLEKTR